MALPTTAETIAPATPASDATPSAADLNAALEAERQKYREAQSLIGRQSQEVGALRQRNRFLEDSASTTGEPAYGAPSTSYTPQYAAPTYAPPFDPNRGIRDNQDMLNLKFELGKDKYDRYYEKAYTLLNDPVRSARHLSVRPQFPSEFDLYKSFASAVDALELQEYRDAVARAGQTPQASSPDPSRAVISGVSASSVEAPFNLESADSKAMQELMMKTPGSISENDPPTFARGKRNLFPGR